VIDDEPVLRTSLQRTLGRDHEVTTAATAIAALEQIRGGDRFDLILCDLMMPDLTGIDVYETLLEIDVDQARRVVFLTGGAFSARSIEFLAATQNLVIDKPFVPPELRAQVHAKIDELGLLGRGAA
jgi:CheY-like chemotaxis protein